MISTKERNIIRMKVDERLDLLANIPQPSLTKKLNNADRAVAPSFPTPTPSKIFCVARTDRS